jgi:hypothetical protein
LLVLEKVVLKRMRDKAHRALAAVHNPPLPPPPDGAAHGIKQEEIEDDDFVVFAGRSRVFRSGGSVPLTPQTVPTPQDPTPSHDEHAVHGAVGESMLGEWLARQEPYVGYDPHYVTAIKPPPPDQHPHQPHQHQHQQRQYGYAPEQPQYTLEVAPPPPHYMTAPYAAYAPPPHPPQHQLLQHPHAPHLHDLHPSSSSHSPGGMGHPPPHGLHRDEMPDMRRDYGVTERPPPPELAQLGFAVNGSRMSETWLSFIQ